MNRPSKLVLFTALVSAAASAQTTVTTSGGTANILPVYTGSSTLGNSPVAVSGNNVGIGTTSPTTALHVTGTISAQTNGGDPSFVLYKGGGGATNLFSGIANTGTNGLNRLAFFTNNVPQWGGSTENMVILNSGNVGIGNSAPQRPVSTENGPIRRGDLLVSSSTPDYAMKGTDRNKLTGTVLGKALETLDSGKGVIEVLISLQ